MAKIEWEKFRGKSVLIGSPVCQEPEILVEFLDSLENLDTEGFTVGYCFIDDNKKQESTILLNKFKEKMENVNLLDVNIGKEFDKNYICDDYTHRWSENLVEKVTRFKNAIINVCVEENYDYLFFIDSDIVLNPLSFKSLISRDKDIISNIFWTKWSPDGQELPQVWLKDAYTFYEANMIKPISQQEATEQTNKFFNKLRKPGVYKVGGLGACTMIKRQPLEKGVDFTKIYNVSFWGEDRYFCIRAVAYGYELYVDTYYSAYHIYRSTDLEGVEKFKVQNKTRNLDILGYEIIDLVTEFLEGYYNYNYKEGFNYNWVDVLSAEEGNRLKAIRKGEEEKLIEEKVISTCKIQKWELAFFQDNSKISVMYKLLVEGIKNSYTFNESGQYSALLKNNNGVWKIEKITKESPIIMLPTPLLRRVRDENKITLSMIVKNEEGRYLERVLEQNKKYISNAVIIDDGSTDRTKEIIKDILGEKNLVLIENNKSMFTNEINLRKLQWMETLKTNPDWILNLDADEVFEDKAVDEIINLVNSNPFCDAYAFRLYDFWDEENYREDKFWNAHSSYRTFLTRYQKNFNYRWLENPLHCGRLPYNLNGLKTELSKLRIKHYGWARAKDRLAKYGRYMKQDPEGQYGDMNQYKAILDPNPRLVKWSEDVDE